MLQALNILRSGVATTIRRLVVGTFYSGSEATSSRRATTMLTIAIDCTMRARLLAIAFDLLPSALVACSSHPSSLLHGQLRF